MLDFIFQPIHRDENTNFSIENQKNVEWNTLKPYLTNVLKLGERAPVGGVHSTGFEFKLNYMNYFPLVPKVVVHQDGAGEFAKIKVQQFYDLKARVLQRYIFSVCLICVSFLMLFMCLMLILGVIEEGRVLFGAIAFIPAAALIMFVVRFIVNLRSRIWIETEEKTKELLSLLGVNLLHEK